MHAVVVNVTVNDVEPALEALRNDVVPQVSSAPGFVAGYWTRQGNTGLGMTIWESEDAAKSASERVREGAPAGVSFDSVEVREVVASA
jgi:heme-degrading monooxygenase HmoA